MPLQQAWRKGQEVLPKSANAVLARCREALNGSKRPILSQDYQERIRREPEAAGVPA